MRAEGWVSFEQTSVSAQHCQLLGMMFKLPLQLQCSPHSQSMLAHHSSYCRPSNTSPPDAPQLAAATHLYVMRAHATDAVVAATAASQQPYRPLQPLCCHGHGHQQVSEVGPYDASAAAHTCRHFAEQHQQLQAEVLPGALWGLLQPGCQEVHCVCQQASGAGRSSLAGKQLQGQLQEDQMKGRTKAASGCCGTSYEKGKQGIAPFNQGKPTRACPFLRRSQLPVVGCCRFNGSLLNIVTSLSYQCKPGTTSLAVVSAAGGTCR